uniref:hypothetical protein n=1 Tax=Carnobacterium sp. TaxID=48221 RepID=UPI00344B5BD7
MLDQNTDRTWFMIGAVVVGALLIGLAQVIFPELLQTVFEKFTSLISGTNFAPTTPGK